MIEVNGQEYELKFNLKRVELIENVTKKSMMAGLVENNGLFPISEIKTYLAYGLKEAGSDSFVKTKDGLDIAEQLLEACGYTAVQAELITAIERDCPFFFRVD